MGFEYFLLLNKRIIIVGVVLGIIIAIAVYVGSPAFLGFDTLR
jgi:hypothetical protein